MMLPALMCFESFLYLFCQRRDQPWEEVGLPLHVGHIFDVSTNIVSLWRILVLADYVP